MHAADKAHYARYGRIARIAEKPTTTMLDVDVAHHLHAREAMRLPTIDGLMQGQTLSAVWTGTTPTGDERVLSE